jgi:hypothetical protein
MKYLKTYDQIRESLNEKINWKKLTDPYHWFKSKDIFQERVKNVPSSVVQQLIKLTKKNGDDVEVVGKNVWGFSDKSGKDNQALWQYLDGHLYYTNPNHKSVYDTLIPDLLKTNENLDESIAFDLNNQKLRGIDEMISVDTSRYERSHGKKPRGKGGWAFYLDDPKTSSPVFTPHSMQYSDAVNWAKEHAKEAGKKIVWVAESNDSIGNIMISEGVWTKIMAGVKRGDNGPWSIVATDYRKVVGQNIDIKFRELIPIHYKDMKEKYPNARLHIEDSGGNVVWSE